MFCSHLPSPISQLLIAMPAAIQVKVLRDDATPRLRQLVQDFQSRPFFAALGKRAEVVLKAHFRAKGDVPMKKGWPSLHFWDRRVRNATNLTSFTDRDATVTVADPAFAAKVFGATIRPKEAGALAIPLQAAAYGKQPSSGLIPGLFLLRTKRHAYLVAYGDADSGQHFLGYTKSGKARYSRDRAQLHFYYILLKQVTVPKDPTALPPDHQINDALLAEAESFARRKGDIQ